MKIDCKITENFLREAKRLCRRTKDCSDCELAGKSAGAGFTCSTFLKEYPSEAIEIVQKWSDTHPSKTYKEDLFEKYPSASNIDGYPRFSACLIYPELKCECSRYECIGCWDRVMDE